MPENRRRGGKRVRKRRGLLTGLILFSAVVLLIFLDGLANWERVTDPTDEKGVEEKDLYRPQGWSEEIVMETETVVWYRDRVRDRFFPVERERLEAVMQSWKEFSQLIPRDTEWHVVPIPPPVIFEADCEMDAAAYRDFLRNLEEILDGRVVDLYACIEERSEEYTYYGEERALTNQGAYYAADYLLNTLEDDALPPLEDYDEELYRTSVKDLTYLYNLPGSKDYCEMFTVREDGEITSLKRPVFRKHGIGTGSVIAPEAFDWAVAEGDGAEEAGVLLLIGDNSGKVLVPFLTSHYRQVYFVDLTGDRWLGTEFQPVEKIFEEYDVKQVLYVRWALEMRDGSGGLALHNFREWEGETTDGEAAG